MSENEGKCILIINGHPDESSFNYALSNAYFQGAQGHGFSVNQLHIASLSFNPNLAFGYRKKTALEPDLVQAIELLKRADHLVWVFPMWWYGYPSLMKGFIERTFLPGIAFKYVEGKMLPVKLFEGKTGRLIITADTPRWYDRLIMKSPLTRQFKKGTLEFCGIKPVKTTYLAPINGSKMAKRDQWIKRIFKMGEKGD